MPVQMDQIAAYAMIVAFFLLFGIFFVTQVQPYTGEEQALPPLSPAAEEVEREVKSKSKRGRIYAACMLSFFLVLGVFLVLAVREEERIKRASLSSAKTARWAERVK